MSLSPFPLICLGFLWAEQVCVCFSSRIHQESERCWFPSWPSSQSFIQNCKCKIVFRVFLLSIHHMRVCGWSGCRERYKRGECIYWNILRSSRVFYMSYMCNLLMHVSCHTIFFNYRQFKGAKYFFQNTCLSLKYSEEYAQENTYRAPSLPVEKTIWRQTSQ